MVIVDEGRKEELEAYLTRSGVEGYTEISQAVGIGVTGPRLGSGAFPRTSAVIFSVLDPAAVDELAAGLAAYCADCGARVRMLSWDVEEVPVAVTPPAGATGPSR